jgi:hypothetical protein
MAKKPVRKKPKRVVHTHLIRCEECEACRITLEQLELRCQAKINIRQWNTVLLQNPCREWDKPLLRALFKVILQANCDVRPSKSVLRAFAEKHGLEDMLPTVASEEKDGDQD